MRWLLKWLGLDGPAACPVQQQLRHHYKHVCAFAVELCVVGWYSIVHLDPVPFFVSISSVHRYGLYSKDRK